MLKGRERSLSPSCLDSCGDGSRCGSGCQWATFSWLDRIHCFAVVPAVRSCARSRCCRPPPRRERRSPTRSRLAKEERTKVKGLHWRPGLHNRGTHPLAGCGPERGTPEQMEGIQSTQHSPLHCIAMRQLALLAVCLTWHRGSAFHLGSLPSAVRVRSSTLARLAPRGALRVKAVDEQITLVKPCSCSCETGIQFQKRAQSKHPCSEMHV